MDEDEDGHGTHCAGVISAVSDNNKGICGISNAKLMALKVFNSAGTSYDSAIIAAFNYIYKAQTLGANIAAINCSWGGGKMAVCFFLLPETMAKTTIMPSPTDVPMTWTALMW